MKKQKELTRKERTLRGLYLLSNTDIRDEVYAIRDKLKKIDLELKRLIKLIENIK